VNKKYFELKKEIKDGKENYQTCKKIFNRYFTNSCQTDNTQVYAGILKQKSIF